MVKNPVQFSFRMVRYAKSSEGKDRNQTALLMLLGAAVGWQDSYWHLLTAGESVGGMACVHGALVVYSSQLSEYEFQRIVHSLYYILRRRGLVRLPQAIRIEVKSVKGTSALATRLFLVENWEQALWNT